VRRLLILSVIALGAVVGVAIAVASTGNNGGAVKSGGATVSVKQIAGHGKVLVDARGRALYRSDQEKKGMALCTGACLSFWQPLKVSGTPTRSNSAVGKLATVKRPDGGRQVTDNGRLLYSFKLDSPGKISGDNFKDAFGGQKFTWHLVRPAGASGTAGATATTTTPAYTYP
jgi:predicted lipoprotein with Yx(FWY)xxD motif